jgi:hypothetical protein
LKVAGDPISGVIHDLADAWVDAIYEIDNPKAAANAPAAEKETRITKPEETR